MTIEKALLERRGYLLAARARQIGRQEILKGCQVEMAPAPVGLEPLRQVRLHGLWSS